MLTLKLEVNPLNFKYLSVELLSAYLVKTKKY